MTRDEDDSIDRHEITSPNDKPGLPKSDKADSMDYTSKNLERIRYKLLVQFCELMQLNTYIHNFGKNAELLIDESMKNNINELRTQYQKSKKMNVALLENLANNSERNRTTLKLLYEEQEHCWKKSKLCTQTAMLDFNELAGEIKLMLEKLEHHSMHDPLTELHNRRYFNAILSYEVSRSERHKHTFCLLMIDLDDFKKINDTYGHFSGDEMLKQFADLLLLRLRKNDVIARIGGDEFSVLLTETNSENGKKTAQELAEKISVNIFRDSQGHNFHCSVSIGIANYPRDAQSLEKLKTCADEALYAAKNAGKNQVACFQASK